MKKYILILFTVALAACSAKKATTEAPKGNSDVAFWLTTGNQSVLLEKQNEVLNFGTSSNENPTIEVDEKQKFQSIDGFGYTLTGGSAGLINALPAAINAALSLTGALPAESLPAPAALSTTTAAACEAPICGFTLTLIGFLTSTGALPQAYIKAHTDKAATTFFQL